MERLLARLREALAGARRSPAPGPVESSGSSPTGDLVEAFGRSLETAGGRMVRVEDEPAARAWVQVQARGREFVEGRGVAAEEELRRAEIGVDRADLLIAETGTVVRHYPGRAAARRSLVPERSVFIAAEDQIVPDLPSALKRVADHHRTGRAYTMLITGPSRTADIEKQLVIPAHGPRELVVLLTRTPLNGVEEERS